MTTEMKKIQEDHFSKLTAFLSETKQPFINVQTDQINRAIDLLKILPAAQEAVLEYYGKFFDYAISTYLKQLKVQPTWVESNNMPSRHEPLVIPQEVIKNVTNIRDALLKLVEENHLVWSHVVLQWSYKLLGKVSKHYNLHEFARMPLGDMLKFWSQCSVANILVDINNKTIAKMVKEEGERSVDSMIEIMLGYKSSSFEWVLAQIGESFPSLIIRNMLICGIKEMCSINKFKHTEKLNSFIRILDHLSITYSKNIKDAVFQLFELSLIDNQQKLTVESITVIPFLLHVARCSTTLLKSILCEHLTQITPEVLYKLSPLVLQWEKYFDEQCGLMDIIVHVLLNADNGIKYVLNMIFNLIGHDDTKFEVLKTGAQSLFAELEITLRTERTSPPVLKALVVNLHFVKPYLLTENVNVAQPAARLLCCIAIRDQDCLSPYIATMLVECDSSAKLETFVEILSFGSNMLQFESGLTYALVKINTVQNNVWNNIDILLSLESNPVDGVSLHGVSSAVINHLDKICKSMIDSCHCGDMKSAHTLSSIMFKVCAKLSGREMSVPKVLYSVKAAVMYFFTCLFKEKDDMFKLKACIKMNKFVNTVTFRSSIARTAAMKYILDGILKEPFSLLFVMPDNRRNDYIVQPPEKTSLLESFLQQEYNLDFGKQVSGQFDKDALNSKYKIPAFKAESVRFNELRLVSFLRSCYSSDENYTFEPTLDTVVSLALLIVQFVSPDVMYNGLPWPDEDFTKVTIERDVHIYHTITTKPIIWTLLGILACHRPALCYCSVLLRAVCACLINHWGAVNHTKGNTRDHPQLMNDTIQLLNTMSLGQLLPKPLDVLGVVVLDLTPQQILIVLRDCVWTYTRDHIPAPALFIRNSNGGMWRDTTTALVPKPYSDSLRLTMIENISQFGDLYARLFINKKEQSTEPEHF
ncbi:integrator complex subunit 5 isoform X2 [Adelges cooleyi]|uniref:integrator complex subunit 5 isoform X2 n=1 Tax=Adelges cooleyi TaxID=133065 RepID=UPI00217FC1F3|nr:integrator complex subunit 5 isoform X2 [Adelges cooleyi]